jgi:hypothetical protein
MGAGAGRIAILALSFVLWGGAIAHAGADSAPVIVVPGRPGIPIMINGRDATGAVVEGDWGLAREQIGVTVIRPPPIGRLSTRDPACWNGLCGSPGARYFPGTGRPPPVGRLEILPPANRALPPPAESYYRFWGIESAPLPPTIEPPHYDIPPLVIGPQRDRDAGRHGPRR